MCSENFYSIRIRMFSFIFIRLFPRDYTPAFCFVDELADRRARLSQSNRNIIVSALKRI